MNGLEGLAEISGRAELWILVLSSRRRSSPFS
jgi:hypothetical protein